MFYTPSSIHEEAGQFGSSSIQHTSVLTTQLIEQCTKTSKRAENIACRTSAGKPWQMHARDNPYKNIHSVSVNISDFAEPDHTAHKSQTFLFK